MMHCNRYFGNLQHCALPCDSQFGHRCHTLKNRRFPQTRTRPRRLASQYGNIQCTDRLDIRSQGSLTGDVVTQRISVEDGAILKGSVQVRAAEQKTDRSQQGKAKQAEPAKPAATEQPKAAAAGA